MIQRSRVVRVQSIQNESKIQPQDQDGQDQHHQLDQLGRGSRNAKKEEMFSLTLLNAQKGDINLPQEQPRLEASKEISTSTRSLMSYFKKKQPPKPKEPISELLPCPKVVKISDALYCIFNANTMDIYKYNPPDRNRNAKKKTFDKLKSYTTKSDIVFVRGFRNMLLVSLSRSFEVYLIEKGVFESRLSFSEPLLEILGGGLDGDTILIFTRTRFKKFRIDDGSIRLIEESTFNLPIQDVKFIDVLKGEGDVYFFVFSERKKVQFSTESDMRLMQADDTDIKQIERQGQAFHIIQLTKAEDPIQYKCQHFDIAKIPEEGMFDLSKIFYLGNKTFLLSLHEQIVVIRKQYSRYIIVDNICVTSNRLTEESKTGQLVLIDKTNIIYNENQRIYVYNMFYNRDLDKLKLEPVDDFKGVDEAQIILYDGILLTPKNTTIQVLFYFNVKKVRRPGRTKSNGPDPLDYSEKEDEKSKLKFSVYGIVQLKPIIKLVELLQAKRPAQQIMEFRSRFQIQPLEYYKSQWSVSEKSLNDIVTHLLEINDQGFIQKELGQVLRKETHTLGFLMKIEEKQIVRLRTALTAKLEQDAPEELVVEAIQRLLEAKMFEKKLKYQNEFEAYKEVDFIDIKKLRETSLREQIKLLSCKGFQRRLKRFLNEFKFLAIANFEGIFNFLMANKDDNDIQTFFLNFGFILPEAVERSIVSCFVEAGAKIKRKEMNDTDECTLWEDFEKKKNPLEFFALVVANQKAPTPSALTEKPETLDTFLHDVYPKETPENRQQVVRLRAILEEFKESQWFREGAFKKHCMLNIDEEELEREFQQLKIHRVYDILFKFLYERITNPTLLRGIIQILVAQGRVPPSYRANVNIRVGVYELLQKIAPAQMREILLSDFIIYSEPDYFSFLVNLSPHIKVGTNENLIMTVIKKVYLEKVPDKGFFEERFGLYLMSDSIKLSTLEMFLKECERLKNQFQSQNQPLLNLLVRSVAKNLTICNNVETKEILGILYNIDLVDPHLEMCAKIVQGFFFCEFYNSLGLEYTYEQFIELTKVSQDNKLFKQMIDKYCKGMYESTTFKYNEQYEGRTISKIINFQKPIDFFQVLKCVVEQVGFDVEINTLVEMFLLRMFLEERYADVKEMLDDLYNYIQNIDPKTFMENLVLKHVDNIYRAGGSMQRVYQHVKGAFQLIDPQTISIKKKRAFVELSLEISKLQSGIFSKFDIEKELENKPMVFLIHLLKSLDIENFDKIPNSEMLAAFEIIYEKMTEAKNDNIGFKANAKKSIEFQEFEIERGYHYLRHGIIKLAIQICEEFSEQSDLYYHDLIYSIVCAICQANKFMEVDQACMIMVQYIILNNTEYDMNKKRLVVTDCLLSLLALDPQKQIEFMKSLQKKIPNKQAQNHPYLKLPSLMDDMIRGLAQQVLGQKMDGRSNIAYYNTFLHLLKHNPIEAFYFMMKNPEMSINNIMHTIQQSDSSQFKSEFIAKYFSLAIYIRSLNEVVDSFYPTYTFFQYKENHLQDDKTRRDINILAARLSLQEMANPTAPKISEILMKYYSMYMAALGENAYIDLTAVDLEVELDVDYENERQRKIDKNELRLRQQLLQTQAKFNALANSLQTRPTPVILQSRMPQLRPTPLPPVDLNELKSPDLPSKTYQKYEDIKNREVEVLKKMEDTNNMAAKAETKMEVDKLIEKYQLQRQERLRKASAKEPSEAQSVMSLRREQREAFEPLTPDPRRQENQSRFEARYARENRAQKPYDQPKKGGIPASTRAQQEKIFVQDGESIASREINLIRKRIDDNYLKMTTTNTAKTLEDFKGYLAKSGQKQILTYLSKIQLTRKKLTLADQFIKKMYEQCNLFANFLKTLEIIIINFEDFSHLYEIKCIKIASHAIRLDSKIDPKKLFDIKFFQEPIPDMDEKQFYQVAYKRLEPNISKIVDDNNVHSLSKMILYGLGMQKEYEYRVYILYLSTRLDEYIAKNLEQKQILALVEKTKSVFAKLNKDLRRDLMRELMQQKGVANRAKIVDLTQRLEESINRTRKVNTSMIAPEDLELLEVMKTL